MLFQHCMYGGKRDKWAAVLSNWSKAHRLRRICDKSHTHEPWGVRKEAKWRFATAEECEYPAGLCESFADLVAEDLDLLPPPPKKRRVERPVEEQRAKAAAGT